MKTPASGSPSNRSQERCARKKLELPAEAALRGDLAAALREAGESAATSTLDVLVTHLRLLARWNPRYGLTRITSWPEILDRHLRESLLPLRWIGPNGRLLDVGSGNGFPALPILACRRELTALLVERSERKSLYLDTVVREAGLERVVVETTDLSRLSQEGVVADRGGGREVPERFDYVISRATLPPARYLEAAAHWVRSSSGRVFLYAGAEVEAVMREPLASAFSTVAREPIPDRHDSWLYVLQLSQPS